MNELTPSEQHLAEQHLAEQLQRQARSLDIGDTAVATVVRRGRQRRERRRVVVGVAVVVALSGTVVGTIQLLSKPVARRVVASTDSVPGDEITTTTPPPRVMVTVPGTAPGEELTPVNRVDSDLIWNVVEPGSAEALGGMSFVSGAVGYQQNPPYLAWSTAPGHAANFTFEPRLWRSDDGIHWQMAGGSTFTQPEILANGFGALNGRLLAFGTAAATAPIPKGGGGDLVVDVSDDEGATWRHVVLPVDLRGLSKMNGVQSIGYNGSFVVGTDAAVAVATPYLNFAPAVLADLGNAGFAISREGLTPINYPTCAADGALTATTLSGVVPPTVEGTVPADTIAPVPSTIVAGYAPYCPTDSLPQTGDLVPWGQLGVDQNAVDSMFTPRVFVSTDGETFAEGVFPPPPDGYQPGAVPQLFATASGFVGMAQFYDAIGLNSVTKLYSSTDGLTWTESDTQLGQVSSIQALPDGTLIAFGQDFSPYPNSGAWVASSSDGVEWTKRSLSGLLEPGDGVTAMLNVWQAAAGPNGITALGNVDVDMAAEAGGYSIEKDGVRLTLTESRYGTLVATDIATGDELGRFDGRPQPTADAVLGYGTNGVMRLLNADGTVRVTFSNLDMEGMYSQQNTYNTKLLILHSVDGINWSREEVEPLTGFQSFGGGRILVTANSVLVSVVEPIPYNPDGTSTEPGAIPKTVVLVGTPKS